MKSLIITLILATSVFAADAPKPGLNDTQKLHLRELELDAARLEIGRQKAVAPYEARLTVLQSEVAGASTEAIKAFKLDPAKWRINLETLEFEEIPAPAPIPRPLGINGEMKKPAEKK